jgi:hypothetical protein
VRRPVRIANFSAYYGDRATAADEVLLGPDPIDVLTGDFLAELTMLILHKDRTRTGRGYASTFLGQMERNLGTCLDRGIRVVVNAGGLNPGGLAGEIRSLARRLSLRVSIAHVAGDDILERLPELEQQGIDLRHLDDGSRLADSGLVPLTANAYLGGWGIAAALEAGADVVVCPRVTDASVTVGPAAWWHGWPRTAWDQLAGAVVAGHIIECGPQATGGNYPFLDEVKGSGRPGFPIAELAADGSCVITKQPGSGGVVSVGTVTAQLLYEVGGPEYLNPDVVTRLDTVQLADDGPNRVAVTGVRGGPPPANTKVALNADGGYRNEMTVVATGLDIQAKLQRTRELLADELGSDPGISHLQIEPIGSPIDDAASGEMASSLIRVTVLGPDPAAVGRRFSDAVYQLVISSFSGCFATSPPTREREYGVYWPAVVPTDVLEHHVVLDDGTRLHIDPSPTDPEPTDLPAPGSPEATVGAESAGQLVRAPLGRVFGARSGDKGGTANVGVWARTPEAYRWLEGFLTVDRFLDLVPDAAGLHVARHQLPNLQALNFVVYRWLGDGVASCTRFDAQAKALGEYLRSRHADLPAALLEQEAAIGVG